MFTGYTAMRFDLIPLAVRPLCIVSEAEVQPCACDFGDLCFELVCHHCECVIRPEVTLCC